MSLTLVPVVVLLVLQHQKLSLQSTIPFLGRSFVVHELGMSDQLTAKLLTVVLFE